MCRMESLIVCREREMRGLCYCRQEWKDEFELSSGEVQVKSGRPHQNQTRPDQTRFAKPHCRRTALMGPGALNAPPAWGPWLVVFWTSMSGQASPGSPT